MQIPNCITFKITKLIYILWQSRCIKQRNWQNNMLTSIQALATSFFFLIQRNKDEKKNWKENKTTKQRIAKYHCTVQSNNTEIKRHFRDTKLLFCRYSTPHFFCLSSSLFFSFSPSHSFSIYLLQNNSLFKVLRVQNHSKKILLNVLIAKYYFKIHIEKKKLLKP